MSTYLSYNAAPSSNYLLQLVGLCLELALYLLASHLELNVQALELACLVGQSTFELPAQRGSFAALAIPCGPFGRKGRPRLLNLQVLRGKLGRMSLLQHGLHRFAVHLVLGMDLLQFQLL